MSELIEYNSILFISFAEIKLSRHQKDLFVIRQKNKSFRKTMELWLAFYYLDKVLQVALTHGHTTTKQYEEYINIPFEDSDRVEMRKLIGGRYERENERSRIY